MLIVTEKCCLHVAVIGVYTAAVVNLVIVVVIGNITAADVVKLFIDYLVDSWQCQ